MNADADGGVEVGRGRLAGVTWDDVAACEETGADVASSADFECNAMGECTSSTSTMPLIY